MKIFGKNISIITLLELWSNKDSLKTYLFKLFKVLVVIIFIGWLILSKKELSQFFLTIKSRLTAQQPSSILIPENLSDKVELKVPGSWQTDEYSFLLVKKNAKIFLANNLESRSKSIDFSKRVIPIFQDDSPPQENAPTWILVKEPLENEILGWMQDKDLLFQSEFFPYSRALPKFKVRRGDLLTTFSIENNGKFIAHWTAKGNGLKLSGKYFGQVYIYDDLLWLRKDTPEESFHFLYLDNKNSLHLEWLFRNDGLTVEEEGLSE